jgi:hypothetical protein
MRSRIVIAVLAASVAILAGGIGNQAWAIDNRTPAPVGHRQPTARDVPATTAPPQSSAEEAKKKMDQDLDRKVRSICRGC